MLLYLVTQSKHNLTTATNTVVQDYTLLPFQIPSEILFSHYILYLLFLLELGLFLFGIEKSSPTHRLNTWAMD